MLYILVIVGILLTLMVTPTQAEYYKGSVAGREAGPVPPFVLG